MAILDTLFGGSSQAELLGGLLGEDKLNQLRSQATQTGLINAAIGYLAQPKNQRFGSALPYLARAFTAGQQGAQGVYDDALRNYQTQLQLTDAKRKQEQEARLQQMLSGIKDPQERLFAELAPAAYVRETIESQRPKPQKTFAILTPDQATAYGLPTDRGQRYQMTDTGVQLISGTEAKEAKARQTREVDVGNKILIVDASTGETIREVPKAQAPKAPKEVSYTVQTDANGNAVYVPNIPGMPVLDITGKPTSYKPAPTAAEAKVQEKQAQAQKLPQLLSEAEKYIKGATGSYLGAGADIAAQTFGISTEGAQNIARLKGIEANLVLSMPRLEGPQSNLDQQLYRQAAGQIGDPTVPADTKLAALETIKKINTKYKSDGMPAETATQDAKKAPMPRVGEERNGYVFRGGNPNDQKSWVKKGR